MRLYITGSEGQLGRELMDQAPSFGFDVAGADLPELDITRSATIAGIFSSFRPDALINAAAYTAVDRAEEEESLAFAANRDGPANLAAACLVGSVPLLHVSTDYVFDGRKGSPYTESDPVSPLGVYGRSKESGERAIRSILSNHIIVRTAWLYGVHGNNFVKTMLSLGREKEVVSVVADQHGSPTSAADLAADILKIAQRAALGGPIEWGTYHYCGRGITTWHGFAEKIFELARKFTPLSVRHVNPITTEAFAAATERPSYSALACDRIEASFGIETRAWEASLQETLNRLLSQSSG